MQRPGPAEGQQCEAARVDALLHRHDAQRAHHLGVGHTHDPLGAGDRVEPELRREAPHRALRGRESSSTPPASAPARVQPAEQEVRVGHGRLDAAAPVARGTGVGARAARPDAQRPARIAPRDRPAARADRVDVDHRQRERAPADLAPGRLAHGAALDDADVARRAAHVEAHEVGPAAVARDERRRGRAARRPRQDGVRRVARGELGRRQAAAGLHDPRLGQPGVRRALEQPPQVASPAAATAPRRPRSSRRARTRGTSRRPRATARRGRPAAARRARARWRARDRDARRRAAGRRRRPRARARRRRSASAAGSSSARRTPPGTVRSLARDAQLRRDERRRPRRAQPVEVRARLAAELDEVGEALGRDEHGARPAALEQRVRRDGHAVCEQLHVAG